MEKKHRTPHFYVYYFSDIRYLRSNETEASKKPFITHLGTLQKVFILF